MITTDTGAKKIEGTDNWRQIFSAHNDSVDAYDANVVALQDALGIVVDGNKSAVAASTGQFIILKNSSIVDSGTTMLADGLYTAAKAIPANTVIDKTYLTADANGGLNALNSNKENKLTHTYKTATTTQYGMIDLGLHGDTYYIAYAYVNGKLAVPGYQGGSGNIFCFVYDVVSKAPVTQTSVTVYYGYGRK